MQTELNPISKAIAICGLKQLETTCLVSYQAIRKWEKAGRLPRTEWTGETNYAEKIAQACENKVTREELLQRPVAVATN